MEQTSIALTVYFDGQFFIGLFERTNRKKLSVARYIFGGEPTDAEVYETVLNKLFSLKFGPSVCVTRKNVTRKNPKVMLRKIKSAVSKNGIGTKAQQAVKAQIEQGKTERKVLLKRRRESEQEKRFEQRQSKKKEKHKGH